MALEIKRPVERALFARLMLDLITLTHDHFLGAQHSIDACSSAVCLCVCLGHIQNRPMTAADISHQLRVSRSTVQRKLNDMERLGVIRPCTPEEMMHTRHRCYYLDETKANSDADAVGVIGILGRIMQGGRAIQAAINAAAVNNVHSEPAAADLAVSMLGMGKKGHEEAGTPQ